MMAGGVLLQRRDELPDRPLIAAWRGWRAVRLLRVRNY